MSLPSYIAYFRVSTAKQGKSGLGLEAQREAVAAHVTRSGGRTVACFTEVESGKRADRPQLTAALAACRAHRAVLLVAKLDRLTRNVAFLANLMESGVEFVACDNPHATRFTVHILAAVAEHEREMISARTRQALTAAKARGVKLGNPSLRAGTPEAARAAAAAKAKQAAARARDVLPIIAELRSAGATSLAQLAAGLMARGVPSPSGAASWHPATVSRALAYGGGQQ